MGFAAYVEELVRGRFGSGRKPADGKPWTAIEVAEGSAVTLVFTPASAAGVARTLTNLPEGWSVQMPIASITKAGTTATRLRVYR